MFKMLILQRLHNLSDERLQYQVSDRLSLMRFLGLELAGNVPNARLTKKGGQSHYGYKNPINIDKDTRLLSAAA
ncbi:hypothetical protein NTGBS_200036 [Candidatus Nitrotoga sp. BS]|nr:hypothetical protein NTGBS_200036 [Candidatus Nitrotoga sp. BS]